ncbi:MAG: hypothetical protein CMH27_09340 [Micavibrio sp.]|nr:hypothetical protein [Micavibrio sp.]|tara:strand:- start:650 stop:1744 length:1095 start_codon:yes stop_codon:yes gene_type:complete
MAHQNKQERNSKNARVQRDKQREEQKEMKAQEQSNKAPRQASNQNSQQIQPPHVNVRDIALTEYISDNELMFDERENEIWTLTDGQSHFRKEFNKKDTLILQGPAGSGKTDITAREVLGFLREGGCRRIILTAPVDEGGEDIGFVPGNTNEKMHDHVSQYLSAFEGHLGQGNFQDGKKILESLLYQNVIELRSLGKLSGENLRNTVLIVDEAHKASYENLLNTKKRLHHTGSKVIFSGDDAQHIRKGVSAFRDFVKVFSDPAYTYTSVIKYNADDVKRHPEMKIMAERGDDIPPGLAARMKAEEFTPERIAGMLSAHFAAAKRDPMADCLIRTLLNRMDKHEILEMLAERQGNHDNNGPDIGPA